MAKRFVETDLWKKKWYRKMPPRMKLFYFYLLTNCDHAGMYDVDLELAEFQIGMEVKQQDVDKHFQDHIEVIKEDKWFIKKFPEFQYGELNPNVKAHASVIKILTRYNCLQRVPNSYKSVQNKDIDKVKVKYKEKEIKEMVEKSDTIDMNDPYEFFRILEKKKDTTTIGYRYVRFCYGLSELHGLYDKDMRVEFKKYWTELNKSGTKMRFELEKTWDTKRRLDRWAKNNFNKKEETTIFKMDTTGKFYIAYCEKCNKSDFYDKFEVKQDSRCCKSKLLPKRK